MRLLPPRHGQALIEVLVAISILVVGLLGVVGLLSRALGLNRVVADNYTATYLASEGIEVAKNIIDANSLNGAGWNAGINFGNDLEVDYDSDNLRNIATGRPLLFDAASRRYSYRSGLETPYFRRIRVELVNGGAAEVKVTSEVNWVTRGGGESKVVLEDHFYNWR